MPQLLPALAAASLLVAGCALGATPVTVRTGTVQLSLAGLYPAGRQLQYLVPGARARVTVSGVGLQAPLVREAPVSGETSVVTLTGVPTGPNRIVTLETLDGSGAPLPGGRFRTTLNLAAGANTGLVSPATSVRGDVYAALLASGSELAGSLDADEVQAAIDQIKRAQRVAHYGLIDGAAIADRLQAKGGRLETLDAADPALVQTPTSLAVEVTGLPAALQATVWVDDPVSPKQSGILNGTHVIQPVKPGSWQLYARAGSFTVGPVALDLNSARRTSVDFSSARLLPQAMPEARGGAAAGMVTVGGKQVLLVAGGTLDVKGANVATDSVRVFDGTTWSLRAPMAVPVSHAGYVVRGNVLFVLGGNSSTGPTDVVQAYDATKDEWTTTLPRLPYPSLMGGAACIDETLYMTSGLYLASGQLSADWYIYKLPLVETPGAWIELGANDGDPQLRFSRYGSAVATVAGKLYIAGGLSNEWALLHRLEVYDPAKGTVRELAPMPTARHGAVTWVKDGKVYVMGGIGELGKALATVEVYDVATDTWSAMPELRVGRGHAAVGELGGRCVLAGGNDGFYSVHDMIPIGVLSAVESLVY